MRGAYLTWVYVVSQLDLPCQDVVLVGSISMLDLLCWAYMLVYVGSAEISTNV